jgi:hypothetical protein
VRRRRLPARPVSGPSENAAIPAIREIVNTKIT